MCAADAEPSRSDRAHTGNDARRCSDRLQLPRASLPQRMNGEHPMTKVITSVAIGLVLLLGLAGGFLHPDGSQALAEGLGEKTVTLAVKNMYCADCPFI